MEIGRIAFDVRRDEALGCLSHRLPRLRRGERHVEFFVSELVELHWSRDLARCADILGKLPKNVMDCATVAQLRRDLGLVAEHVAQTISMAALLECRKVRERHIESRRFFWWFLG